MEIKIYHVDAFSSKPFAGNQAKVCILPKDRDEKWMQAVAYEMKFSETAFLFKVENGYSLRWFTPLVEVDLCGHATLASAHILWEEGYLEPNKQARFFTKSGLLTAKQKGNWIELDFPPVEEKKSEPPDGLIDSLGVTPVYVGKNRFDYLVEVQSEEIVRSLKPDFEMLKSITELGVIVTSLASSPEFDFVSRYFAPGQGINEDPVTGSTHCCLGPYWSNRLSKNEFVAYQASSRGGTIKVRVGTKRVFLCGQATTVMRGKLLT